ncbi:MAG: 1,4-dihydroxy-2-naphthoate octaprenyltransferase [Bacteroidaceae bacterium]|nr:1,4-dihydroxy-2-naphthoate octaprenyltransferase [Bacteroidaceae bacterium]
MVVKRNSLYAWWLAARPKTLTGAAAPVLVGGALAWHDSFAPIFQSSSEFYVTHADSSVYLGQFYILFYIPFLLCLLFAFMMQIDANFVNDYFDFKKGTDREDRLGPERACAQGWISPRAMAWGIGICTVLSCLVGCVILLWDLQWELLAVGIACVLGCFLYTTKFSYLGLGDVLVLLFFGIVPVGFTYYVITKGAWSIPLTLVSIGMGLATDNLLMVNNYRDRHQDAISGKKTVVVRFGERFGTQSYLWLGLTAAILAVAACAFASELKWCWLLLIYVVLHLSTWDSMRKLEGKELNRVLGKTARNIFVYGLVVSLCFWL